MLRAVREFLKLEISSAVILMGVALLALISANTALSPAYHAIFDTPIYINLGVFSLSKSASFWINDGLMPIFFFLIGLEIKREVLAGELSQAKQRILPGIATLGGVVFPAVLYCYFNYGNSDTLRGWAIPTATDIAFALGVLALAGSRIPSSLKVFLMTIAVLDDLVAVFIIAIFYTEKLSGALLSLACLFFLGLMLLNYFKVERLSPYAILGSLLWASVLNSGVHPTVAGVMTALTIPLNARNKGSENLLVTLEKTLHPWVAFFILPLFAYANAGVALAGLERQYLFSPVSMGILVGLFVGKQLGIFSLSWITVKLGWAKLPENCNWAQVYGMAILCGIGFTMSLFIGSLAFKEGSLEYEVLVKNGIVLGSLLSAIAGFGVLYCSQKTSD